MQVSLKDSGIIIASKEINEYLQFGYHIPKSPASFLISGEGGSDLGLLPPRTPSGANILFSRIIEEACSANAGPYLVPLSGGWDSRILLSELCRHVDKSNIRAITFGVPGALDYDLGLQFADHIGVRSERIDLSVTPVTWGSLVEASRIGKGVMPTLSWPNLLVLRDAAQRSECVLSGFIGDFVNGGHDRYLDSLPEADFFGSFSADRKMSGSAYLVSKEFAPERRILRKEHVTGYLSPRQAMFLWFRVLGFTAPAILGQPMTGWVGAYKNPFNRRQSIITPFTDERWVRFWMGVHKCERYDQTLFFRMVKEFYPVAYEFPSKDGWGLNRNAIYWRMLERVQHRIRSSLHGVMPWVPVRSVLMDNYLDFQQAFRRRDDYISVMQDAIKVLQRSEVVPWLDLNRIWREHYQGRRDHSQAMNVLLGLATNLEAYR